MTKKKILAALKKERTKLAKSRDNLRDLASEVDSQYEDANAAIQDLDCCIDKLSEQV